MLRAVAKHSPGLALAVVACGGVDALVLSLEEFDPGVKEAAAWALGYVARHNERKLWRDVDATTQWPRGRFNAVVTLFWFCVGFTTGPITLVTSVDQSQPLRRTRRGSART